MRRSSRPIHGKSAVVIGAGAIGSHLLEHVARMPEVDRVTVVDRDVYQPKNLWSQAISPREAGCNKAVVWAARMRRIRPELQVTALAADVRDIPLAHFQSDVILSCVDSRLARQLISQKAHRLGVPWIDAGIDGGSLLARVSTYQPAADQPCLECSWDDRDYAALEVEYTCQETYRQPPTNAPSSLGALAAALQSIEGHKVFRQPDDTTWGRQILMDARVHKHYVSRYVRNPDCRFDHRVWDRIDGIPRAARDVTIADALGIAGIRGSSTSLVALSVEMHTFVQRSVCFECGHEERIRPLPKLDASLANRRCRRCGCELVPLGIGLLTCIDMGRFPRRLFLRSLRDLGLRPGDIYTIHDSKGERHFRIPLEKPS